MTTRRSKLGWQAAKFAGRTTEKAVVGLARWATTDHTGSWNTARKQAGLPAAVDASANATGIDWSAAQTAKAGDNLALAAA